MHIISDSVSLSNVASALGVSSYMPISKYGSYTALIIVEELKVESPATSISLSSSMMNDGKIEIDRDALAGNGNYKKGIITITAKKQPGTVYVWVIDTGNEKGIAYTQINVKLAPSKIKIVEEPDMTTVFKK